MNELRVPTAVLRVELTCFYCGHAYGEVRVAAADRPTYAEIRAAIDASPRAPEIAWDRHGAPRCPRCGGKLFIEESERRVYANADAAPGAAR